jgi:hypothetical protein
MKKIFLILITIFCQQTFSNENLDNVKKILDLKDQDQLLFSISQMQIGNLKVSSLKSHVTYKLKLEILHYNQVEETEDSLFKKNISIRSNHHLLAESSEMMIPLHDYSIELVPVYGVARITIKDLNDLLARIPNPFYADLKISLVQTEIFSEKELANISFDMSYLRFYIDSGLRKNQSLNWNLKNDSDGTNAFLKIRLIQKK